MLQSCFISGYNSSYLDRNDRQFLCTHVKSRNEKNRPLVELWKLSENHNCLGTDWELLVVELGHLEIGKFDRTKHFEKKLNEKSDQDFYKGKVLEN
jgi:hypothetical protein